jgi:hypothetical protein
VNPSAALDPLAFHPSGSLSEQMIAGERSPVDPLKLKTGGSFRQKRRDTTDDSDRVDVKEKAPSLREIEDEKDMRNVGP